MNDSIQTDQSPPRSNLEKGLSTATSTKYLTRIQPSGSCQ